ncbi:hypothetical protein HZ326_27810 [Fusarium oxysporum f. sp. albedinis]|nr:hypothetical protein HZ326_30627 [Fusarium oxysporum f. sp. albedinis]KAJ0129097.1 hypothetical protein HZ326_27810 [Fusarium oxysporum f. sp. albedinis]
MSFKLEEITPYVSLLLDRDFLILIDEAMSSALPSHYLFNYLYLILSGLFGLCLKGSCGLLIGKPGDH